MYCKIHAATLLGIQSISITVEVDISPGLPVFEMVGNISNQVKEGKERIRTSLHYLGIILPAKRITVNLSPAKVRKNSASFDVPIAVALLCSLGVIDEADASEYLFIGELNLSGEILPVNGILPIVSDASSRGVKKFILPMENVQEAELIEGVEVYGFRSLKGLIEYFQTFDYEKIEKICEKQTMEPPKDFSEVNGQPLLKRAAEISAAGLHNLLIIGPPGAGKTMIAERVPSILPPLTRAERMELSKIYSVKGLLTNHIELMKERPFRSPHHSISKVGMTGGGYDLLPGEISLSHSGVLFLDELTEFEKDTLELLRQPLEDKKITITRQSGTVEYPSRFLLLGAMNPCNCGYYPNLKRCRCTPGMRRKYLQKLSQPLLDRIDLFVQAEPLSYLEISQKRKNESSAEIKKRVLNCHEIQLNRYKDETFWHNSSIPSNVISKYCALGKSEEAYMKDIYEQYKLTGRTYHKILRVARTIADLDGAVDIQLMHLKEAVLFRSSEDYFGEEGLS